MAGECEPPILTIKSRRKSLWIVIRFLQIESFSVGEFLDVSTIYWFFYFLYCPGVTPNLFLNTMLNCVRLEYPMALAIAIVLRSVLSSRFCAYSNLFASK